MRDEPDSHERPLESYWDYRGRVGAAQKEEKDRVERVLKVLGLARR
jgi:hypothetical protein